MVHTEITLLLAFIHFELLIGVFTCAQKNGNKRVRRAGSDIRRRPLQASKGCLQKFTAAQDINKIEQLIRVFLTCHLSCTRLRHAS